MRAGIQVLQTAHECGSSRNPQEACTRQDTVISDSVPNIWPGAACRIVAPWMSELKETRNSILLQPGWGS